jgi:outer membrane protein TolC
MIHKKLIILILLFSSLIVAQESTQKFSLQEAIDFALENNRTAKNAVRDVEAAEKQKWETISTGLPQINASIDYQNFLKQQVSVIPAEFFGGNQGEFTEVIFGTKQSVTGFATLNQKIFDGSYIVGLQSVKVFLEITKNAKLKTDLEVRKAVINAYGNVLIAEQSTTILESNKSILEKNLFEITKMYENGMEEEESVEQIQISLSSITSDLNKVVRLKKIAYQMLNITMGQDINTDIVLTENLENLTLQNMSLDLLESESDIENNVDYLIAQNDKKSKELLLKLEKSKALPTLDAFVNGGYSAFSDNFSFAKDSQKWFGSSLFGVNMTIPIFSSLGRTASTQRAQINLSKAEDDLIETEQKLQLEIDAAKSEYQFTIEDYANKKQNLQLAERIEAKNETKFFEGIASSFDLRQAQVQLYNAQQEYLQAMLDVINKKAELETLLNSVNNY